MVLLSEAQHQKKLESRWFPAVFFVFYSGQTLQIAPKLPQNLDRIVNKKRSSPSLSSSPWCLKQVWFKTIHGYILHLSSSLKIKTCLTSKRGTIWMEFHCQQTKSKHVLSVLMSLCQFSWMWWFGDKRL